MLPSKAIKLPVGTRLKPTGNFKTSNYTQLQNIEEVEITTAGNCGGGGGSYGAILVNVKVVKCKGLFIFKEGCYGYTKYGNKNTKLRINPKHFEILSDNYPIF